jgi:hypothetical protein
VVETGHNWSKLVETGRNWPKLAENNLRQDVSKSVTKNYKLQITNYKLQITNYQITKLDVQDPI